MTRQLARPDKKPAAIGKPDINRLMSGHGYALQTG